MSLLRVVQDWMLTLPKLSHYPLDENPPFMTHELITMFNWHERAAFQRSSFGRSRSGGRLLAMT